MFILIEDQYAVGDTVTVAGVTGEVIEINPRRTVLRDVDGNLHHIPNSSITLATNRTASLNRVVVDLEVPFREAEDARTLVNAVAAELLADRPRDFTSAPRVADIRADGDGDVVVRVIADARDGMKWEAESELRRRRRRWLTAGHALRRRARRRV
jgi:small conductance mechanosensitive channel